MFKLLNFKTSSQYNIKCISFTISWNIEFDIIRSGSSAPLSLYPGHVCRLCEVAAKPHSESCVWRQPWLLDTVIEIYRMQRKSQHHRFLLEVVSVLHCWKRHRGDSTEEEEAGSPSSRHDQHCRPQDPAPSDTGDKRHGREPGRHAPRTSDSNHGQGGSQTGGAQWTQRSSSLQADERQTSPWRAAETTGETESQTTYVFQFSCIPEDSFYFWTNTIFISKLPKQLCISLFLPVCLFLSQTIGHKHKPSFHYFAA